MPESITLLMCPLFHTALAPLPDVTDIRRTWRDLSVPQQSNGTMVG